MLTLASEKTLLVIGVWKSGVCKIYPIEYHISSSLFQPKICTLSSWDLKLGIDRYEQRSREGFFLVLAVLCRTSYLFWCHLGVPEDFIFWRICVLWRAPELQRSAGFNRLRGRFERWDRRKLMLELFFYYTGWNENNIGFSTGCTLAFSEAHGKFSSNPFVLFCFQAR